jgi:branched-chain amino acid transport system ATP-binding protein
MELLSIKGVSKNFRGLRALDKVNIDVPKGHIFGLIGPNGSGKTTLLNVITGFIRPTKGQVLYKGEPITGLKPHAVTQRGIARTFQLASVYPNLTVEENIIVGRHLKIRSGTLGSFFHTPSYRLEQSKLRQKARELMALLEVEERRDVLAKNLAFGDERKLEIAIALASEPELLLMDEPAAGMNPDEQLRLMRFVRAMTAEFGITVVIIEHNMRVIMGLCRSIAVLDYGVKMAEGTPDEIANNEKVISAYLGQSQLD